MCSHQKTPLDDSTKLTCLVASDVEGLTPKTWYGQFYDEAIQLYYDYDILLRAWGFLPFFDVGLAAYGGDQGWLSDTFTEVKQRRPRSVLGWVTARDDRML